MSEIVAAWRRSLDEIKREVTGRTLWQALDAVVPITMEGDTVILGVPHLESSMIGHLKSVTTMRIMERKLNAALGQEIKITIISGTDMADWEGVKARDSEVQHLQQREYSKAFETKAKEKLWDSTYEKLSRIYAAIPNKGLPQKRAKFLVEGVDEVAAAVNELGPELDDVGERSLARLIERIASYTDVGATEVALMVLQKLGQA